MNSISRSSDVRKAMGLLSCGLRPRPAYVVFQLTRRCNLRCEFCDFYKNPTRPAAEMTLDDIDVLGARLAERGPCVVCISGGEPTIRKDLPDVARRLARWHVPTLITNGAFMTPRLARDLYDAGMAEVSVSVDYADPRRHDARRGIRGSWRRALRALRHLREAASGWNRRVYMNSILFADNVDDIEPLLRLAGDLGVTYRLSLYSPLRGRMTTPAAGIVSRLLDLKRRYPHFVSLDGYLRGIDGALDGGVPDCTAGRLFFFVDARGDVFRCVEQRDPPVGNALRDPLADLVGRLAAQCAARACAECWTSTRGSTETLLARSRLRAGAEFVASLRR